MFRFTVYMLWFAGLVEVVPNASTKFMLILLSCRTFSRMIDSSLSMLIDCPMRDLPLLTLLSDGYHTTTADPASLRKLLRSSRRRQVIVGSQ